jgi:hypothetical protein
VIAFACSAAEGHQSLASTTPAITSTTLPIAIFTPRLLNLDISDTGKRFGNLWSQAILEWTNAFELPHGNPKEQF